MTKYINTNQLPLSLAVWLATDDYDHSDVPNTLSATTLLNPIRSIILSLQNQHLDKKVDLMSLIPSRMGTSIHTSIEKAWESPNLKEVLKSLGYPESVIENIRINPDPTIELNPDILPIYMEQRVSKTIAGFNITGKYDLVLDGGLEDFKSTGVYTYISGSNTEKYIQQGSIYRWLNPQIITKDYMNIRFIFTDWNKIASLKDSKYPPNKITSQTLQLMSIPETEVFIRSILNTITKYKSTPQHDLPMCNSNELWQKPDVWKYYKNPDKLTKSTKNFDNATEAYQKYSEDGSVGLVKYIPGEVIRCKYCNVREICDQAKDFINNGILNI